MAENSTNSLYNDMIELIHLSSSSYTANTASEDDFVTKLKLLQSYLIHEDKNILDEPTEFEIGILDIEKVSRYCLSSFSFSKYLDVHLNDTKILCLHVMTFWLKEINKNHSRIQHIKEFCDWTEFYLRLEEQVKQKSANEPESDPKTAEATLQQELQARVKNYQNDITMIILSEAHLIKPEILINVLRSFKIGNTIIKGLFNSIEDPLNKMFSNIFNSNEDEFIREPQNIISIFKQIRILYYEIFYSLDRKKASTKYLAFYIEELEKSSLKISRLLLYHYEKIILFSLGSENEMDDNAHISNLCRLVFSIASKSSQDPEEKGLYRIALNGILDFFFDNEMLFIELIKNILENRDSEVISILFESEIWTNQVFVRKTIPLLDFPSLDSIFSLKFESKRASFFLFLIVIMHSSVEKIRFFSGEALNFIKNMDQYHLIMVYKYLESWKEVNGHNDERTILYLNMVLTDAKKFNFETVLISLLEKYLDIQSFMNCWVTEYKSLGRLEQNRSKSNIEKKKLISGSIAAHFDFLKSVLEFAKQYLDFKSIFTILDALFSIDDVTISKWISNNFETESIKEFYLNQHLVFSEVNLEYLNQIFTFWESYIKSPLKDKKEYPYCEILWDFVLRTESSYVSEVCLKKIYYDSNLSVNMNLLYRKQILRYFTKILEAEYENRAVLRKKIVTILGIIESKFSINLQLEEYSARPHCRLTNTKFIRKIMNYERKNIYKGIKNLSLVLPNNISYYEYLDIGRGYIELEKNMLSKLECSPYNETSKAFNIEDDDNETLVLKGKSLFDSYYPEPDYIIQTYDNQKLGILNRCIARCFEDLFNKFSDKSRLDRKIFFEYLINAYGSYQNYHHVRLYFKEFRIPQCEFFDRERFLNFNTKRLLESNQFIKNQIMAIFGPDLKEINFESLREEYSIVNKIFSENPQLFLNLWNLITKQEAEWKIYKFLSKMQTNQTIFSSILHIEENPDWNSYFDIDCLPKFTYKIHLIAHILSNKSDDLPNTFKEDARLFGDHVEKKRNTFQQRFFLLGGLEFLIKNLEDVIRGIIHSEELLYVIRRISTDIAFIINHYLRIGLIYKSPVLSFGADIIEDQCIDSQFINEKIRENLQDASFKDWRLMLKNFCIEIHFSQLNEEYVQKVFEFTSKEEFAQACEIFFTWGNNLLVQVLKKDARNFTLYQEKNNLLLMLIKSSFNDIIHNTLKFTSYRFFLVLSHCNPIIKSSVNLMHLYEIYFDYLLSSLGKESLEGCDSIVYMQIVENLTQNSEMKEISTENLKNLIYRFSAMITKFLNDTYEVNPDRFGEILMYSIKKLVKLLSKENLEITTDIARVILNLFESGTLFSRSSIDDDEHLFQLYFDVASKIIKIKPEFFTISIESIEKQLKGSLESIEKLKIRKIFSCHNFYSFLQDGLALDVKIKDLFSFLWNYTIEFQDKENPNSRIIEAQRNFIFDVIEQASMIDQIFILADTSISKIFKIWTSSPSKTTRIFYSNFFSKLSYLTIIRKSTSEENALFKIYSKLIEMTKDLNLNYFKTLGQFLAFWLDAPKDLMSIIIPLRLGLINALHEVISKIEVPFTCTKIRPKRKINGLDEVIQSLNALYDSVPKEIKVDKICSETLKRLENYL